ncbi:MAG: glutamate racemase [Candidatus Cloacimonadia bacterium]
MNIGIFDSGIGGLTVFGALRKRYPSAGIVYFGDMARVPYGSKSREAIIRYSQQNATFLVQQNIDLLIVACNTSSAWALDMLRENFRLPIVDVIQPGTRKAVEVSRNKKIGVIGTEATIKSGAYEQAIHKIEPRSKVISCPTPLLVPLVEENWISHQVTKKILIEYLTPLLEQQIDTLVLGCTHYPLLKDTIQQVVGNNVTLVDSAEAITNEIHPLIESQASAQTGHYKFFVSDNPQKFREFASHILGLTIQDKDIELVYFAEGWIRKIHQL